MALDKPAKPIMIRPRANSDIDELADHIAQDNLEAAIRFMDSLQNTLELIGGQPGIDSLTLGHVYVCCNQTLFTIEIDWMARTKQRVINISEHCQTEVTPRFMFP